MCVRLLIVHIRKKERHQTSHFTIFTNESRIIRDSALTLTHNSSSSILFLLHTFSFLFLIRVRSCWLDRNKNLFLLLGDPEIVPATIDGINSAEALRLSFIIAMVGLSRVHH